MLQNFDWGMLQILIEEKTHKLYHASCKFAANRRIHGGGGLVTASE
jgi:hypothetical protein